MDLDLGKIVETLKRGGVVAWPTDTTWGLLAAAECPEAIERIFEIKGRPREKPLQLLVANVAVAEELTDVDRCGLAWKLLTERFWPGALTLVVPASAKAPAALVHAGKVGLRIPNDDRLRELIAAMGGWLAATSLNRSGEAPAASYEEALTFADEVDLVHPGKSGGTASSVYELPEGRLLRSGPVSESEIEAVLEAAWTKD
ncbi:L-threonylcarbamoyladenylate synthase [Oceanithermus sp.]